MIVLVVSDFHMGRGQYLQSGQVNLLEDFFEDDRFAEFLEYYSTGKYQTELVNLVLNGDIFNLLQIDVEAFFNYVIDEDFTIKALNRIMDGHPNFITALRSFVQVPNKKITYVIGNHDAGMLFEGPQQRLCDILGHKIDFKFYTRIGGIHIEHGHRFEAVNAIADDSLTLPGPNGRAILNLSWGSLFVIRVLPILKKERPHIDRIRPMSIYMKWCLFNDPFFLIKVLSVFLKNFLFILFSPFAKKDKSIRETLRMLRDVTMYPSYGRLARAFLKQNPEVHTVIMGHIHIAEWRKFAGKKYYFNSGSWNPIPTVDAAVHENLTKLTYVHAEINDATGRVHQISQKVWQGQWRPYREENLVNL